MRIAVMLAAVTLTALAVTPAEARRRGISFSSVPAVKPVATPRAGGPVAFVAPRGERPAPAPAAPPPVAAPATAPEPPAAVATFRPAEREANPGCPAERVVGKGAGFCTVN
ncbi:hypothetical protein [Salinarimonas soli]|uniref:Uncharacterized protein n=1 Tax=Salinarimonas soli TaxID=1638099 RepID=A0A5B2VR09_9HYPH|nr:hypothetical protein [Salinarimonas soli]KAA2241234.1 hypothetical protein F0L46_04360 [Salinarimonas soli]